MRDIVFDKHTAATATTKNMITITVWQGIMFVDPREEYYMYTYKYEDKQDRRTASKIACILKTPFPL